MEFTLYTDKSVAQCMTAITERMQAKATSTRPEMMGSIEKGGRFTLSVSSYVFGFIPRSTRLTATAQRDGGSTVIRGHVADGVTPQWRKILGVVLGIVCFVLILSGQAVLALVALFMGTAAYVPFIGDYQNSETLLLELEKTLKAAPKSPAKKEPAPKKPAAVAKSAPAKSTQPKKPTSR